MLKKVMVVDDSNLVHSMYKMVLLRYKCQIISAVNGQDALDKLAKNTDVDLVLCDINMPVLNGLEFVKKVKEGKQFENLPIIMVSTEGREEETLKALSLGARGYVKKPFQPSELHALIDQLFPKA